MADVIPETRRRRTGDSFVSAEESRPSQDIPADDDLYKYVEALFFAYRDFISEPDRILSEIGFGRAHHRVLHFVDRYPGMRVADLLDILQITKQSLARVLRELVREGYVTQKSGKADKRERLLYVTEKGAILARRLVAPQLARIRNALVVAGKDGDKAVAHFLDAMIGEANRFPFKQSPEALGRGDKGPVRER